MTESSAVYAIIQLEVTDPTAFFRDYAGPLQPISQKHGVEVVAASAEPQVIEGDYGPNFTVILRFPSAQAQADWYADPEYQPLLARRREVTNLEHSTFVLLPSFAGLPT